MRSIILLYILVPVALCAQDPARFARAMERGPSAVDRWMERTLGANKRGDKVDNGSTTYTVHYHTYDTLADYLKQQPGVIDAAWDKCMVKILSWPGHSRIGVQFTSKGGTHERCYLVQEGRPGTLTLFGWRPRIRRTREHLKFLGVVDCPGFVEKERRRCEEGQP